MTDDSTRWNHNIHYHALILAAVPDGARTALDVGCGEGMLTRRLRQLVPTVVGIDADEASIDLARSLDSTGSIDYLLGDFLTYPFNPASFDLIASVAALHHMPADAALDRMRELLKPGGALAIVGLARGGVGGLPYDLAGAIAHRHRSHRTRYWDHPSPTVWPPPLSYRQMWQTAERHLPGVRRRRHVLWRYSLTWTKPPG